MMDYQPYAPFKAAKKVFALECKGSECCKLKKKHVLYDLWAIRQHLHLSLPNNMQTTGVLTLSDYVFLSVTHWKSRTSTFFSVTTDCHGSWNEMILGFHCFKYFWQHESKNHMKFSSVCVFFFLKNEHLLLWRSQIFSTVDEWNGLMTQGECEINFLWWCLLIDCMMSHIDRSRC